MFESINLSDLGQRSDNDRKGQTMKLNSGTHMYSCIHLVNYLYQLSVQGFL